MSREQEAASRASAAAKGFAPAPVPPVDAHNQQEWERLQAELSILNPNLQALEQQRSLRSRKTPQAIEDQYKQVKARIVEIEQRLSELSGV